MANFCGGIRLDSTTLKVINGVICDANATTVDRSKAVSTCGQLWDGFLLTVNVTPDTASIKVVDADSVEVTPVAGKTNVFLLSDIGDKYGVNV